MTSTAQFLKGDCWISGVVPSGDSFDVISMNITMSTKDYSLPFLGEQPVSYRPRLCDTDGSGDFIMSNTLLTGKPFTIFTPMWTKRPYPILYGKSSIQELPDPTLYFDSVEASQWDAVQIPNPNAGTPDGNLPYIVPDYYDLAGPKYKYINCFQRLFKRLPDKEFVGKYKKMMNVSGVRWQGSTDRSQYFYNYPNEEDYYGREYYPIEDTDPQLYYDRGDWLTNLLPASPIWCNPIDQPLLGEVYYEDAHYDDAAPTINKDLQNFRADFMPFCTPLNVRNSSGSVIGTYDGLGFQGFFNYAGALSPQIPTFDYTHAPAVELNPENPIPIAQTYKLLQTHKQLLSFELWIYLSATGNIKSPRIAQLRWFWYTDYITGGGYPSFSPVTPFRPLLFFNCPLENMDVSLTLKLTSGGTKNVLLPLHRLQVAVRT